MTFLELGDEIATEKRQPRAACDSEHQRGRNYYLWSTSDAPQKALVATARPPDSGRVPCRCVPICQERHRERGRHRERDDERRHHCERVGKAEWREEPAGDTGQGHDWEHDKTTAEGGETKCTLDSVQGCKHTHGIS